MSVDPKEQPAKILNAADFAAECQAMGYPPGVTRVADILPDPRRRQCEHLASILYERIDVIMDVANYAGQMEQSGEAVKHEFVRRVADIIQKELEWTNPTSANKYPGGNAITKENHASDSYKIHSSN